MLKQAQTSLVEGVEIKFFEKKDAPIYIRFIFQAGSRYDKKEGTSHFLEHMICAGSEKFPSKDLLAEYIESVGGQFGLFTTFDSIYLNIQIAEASDLNMAMNLFDQMINHSLFSLDIIERERGAIFSEQSLKKTNQKDYVYVINQKLLFQKTILEKTILGTKETVANITIDDLVEFKNKNLTKDNLSIIVSGDLDLNKFKSELLKVLPQSSNENKKEIKKLPIIKENKGLFEIYQATQASLIFGFRLNNFDLKNKVCADICADYLGGGRASLLIKELRYKRGLVYSIFVQNKIFLDSGIFIIKTDCGAEVFSETTKVIKESIENLYKNSISEEKIDFIKTKIKKSFKIKVQNSQSIVEQNELFSVVDYIEMLNSISTTDIKSFIIENLDPQDAHLSVCGSESVKEFI
jgi:predicted Zn-dependent peptidase